MNPVTAALLKDIEDVSVIEFVALWDEFEELAIAIYKRAAASEAERQRFGALIESASIAYPALESALQPHWRGIRVKGQELAEDPFVTLLKLSDADAIIENWAAMQLLPAAREALNHYLLALSAQ